MRTVMKEYRSDNNFNTHKRRKNPKRHTLHGFIYLFLVLCCCLTVFAIGLLANNYSFATVPNEPPNSHLSTGTVTNTDFNTDSVADTQSNDNETVSTADTQSNTDVAEWFLILVNKWIYLPDDYEAELTELSNGQSVDKQIYPALQKMFDAARSNGVYPVVVSGYRTAEEQQSLLDEKIADYKAEGYSSKDAITKAEAWVAVPGTSEHQLGIAVDINADGINSTGQEVYEWLDQNSYKFGFIRRYPPDKTDITGVINEPWHYRYVGAAAATEMYNRGICLEEYLGKTNEPAASNGVLWGNDTMNRPNGRGIDRLRTN